MAKEVMSWRVAMKQLEADEKALGDKHNAIYQQLHSAVQVASKPVSPDLAKIDSKAFYKSKVSIRAALLDADTLDIDRIIGVATKMKEDMIEANSKERKKGRVIRDLKEKYNEDDLGFESFAEFLEGIIAAMKPKKVVKQRRSYMTKKKREELALTQSNESSILIECEA